jgi:hypothetical protein
MNTKKLRKEQATRDTETNEQRNNKYIVRDTVKGNINEQGRQWMYGRN